MAKTKRRAAAVTPPTLLQRVFGQGQSAGSEVPPDTQMPPRSTLSRIREWTDAIVIATLVAMMVRTFVVEPFKIPSGSMTPELLGDLVAEGIANGRDGKPGQFLVVMNERRITGNPSVQVYQKDSKTGYWLYQGRMSFAQLTFSQQQMVQKVSRVEEHRILVNRFAYWFSQPQRGDVAIFRVPFDMQPKTFKMAGGEFRVREFNPSQPVYVKRVVGLPGEEITILGNQRRLTVNGQLLESPPPFDHNEYGVPSMFSSWSLKLKEGEYALFGDNTDNSEDSRYWGPVAHERLRGKAFLVYWPLKRAKFL